MAYLLAGKVAPLRDVIDGYLRVPVLDGRRRGARIGGHEVCNRTNLLPLPLILGCFHLSVSHLHRRELGNK